MNEVKNMRYLLLVSLIGLILVSGCAQSGTQPVPTGQVQPTGDLKEFTIEGSEFKFSPASITVNKGDEVKITFKNTGSAGHNFVISDLGVSTKIIPGGSTETVEFTADRSGTFSFYCSVPGHRAGGMEGHISIS